MDTVFVAEATHCSVPGCHRQVSRSKSSADKFAADRVRMILTDLFEQLGGDPVRLGFTLAVSDISESNWEASFKTIEKFFDPIIGMEGCDVWISEETIVD